MIQTNANRLLRDAKLFNAKLGHIDGAGNTGTYLIQLVESRVVAQNEPQEKKRDEKKGDDDMTKGEEKPVGPTS